MVKVMEVIEVVEEDGSRNIVYKVNYSDPNITIISSEVSVEDFYESVSGEEK